MPLIVMRDGMMLGDPASPPAMEPTLTTAFSVAATLRLVRKNSRAPSQVSSNRTCRLTAPCVTLSSSAARVKLPSRAAASKALIAFNGGRRDRTMLVSFSHSSRQNKSFVVEPSHRRNL